MSQLCVLNRAILVSRCTERLKQRSLWFQRQQRLHVEGPNPAAAACSKRRSKSWLWLCGLGLGVAVAVGLKTNREKANVPCGDGENLRIGGYEAAIEASRELLKRIQVGTRDDAEVGAPGLVVGVSVNGHQVWSEGFGYSDLENRVPCGPTTVMRIASISKPLTSAAAALLCEEGKLDLDAPVQKYVPEFPVKQFDGQDVTITPRLLLSHLSGIRHYEKDGRKVREKAKRPLKPPAQETEEEKSSAESKPNTQENSAQAKKEFEQEEYYLKDNFENVIQALDLFKDDPLIYKPGTTFLYSTHGFTLLSAVMERASGQRFLDLMMSMFYELGMDHTVAEQNDPIIYHRSRFYHVNKKGRVVNCPYVDNSYKWAGGGFLSNVEDLLLFGNALLYSYQVAQLQDPKNLLPGFLKPKTIQELWEAVDRTESNSNKDHLYAQGWMVVKEKHKYGQCKRRRCFVSHTGGAVGASSVLLVLPTDEALDGQTLPRGVVVTILMNVQGVGLKSTAFKIAHEFDKSI
ncbi:serine beta-lactamase-like protein LACTB, mitochondrial isoform X1 [Synchiropus splendidus]|uniref:serine beta-lactamase-like protein LACTB, mitochondrial isoform X1 n=1 Tax=Synchiropus splendidus TaxID=270530 RepID=UPI00237E1AD9|nr:serine beta-lactamase-like protein LACTB, mitochondrial isoform X1 [Synchiropus splendidus]